MQSGLVERSRISVAGSREPARPAEPSGTTVPNDRTTVGGKVAFLIGLSLLLSSIPEARIPIGGLQAHAYLLLLAVAGLVALGRRSDAPNVSLHGVGLLFLLGALATNLVSDRIGEAVQICVKWVTLALTFVVVARLLRTHRDLQLAIIGLVIGVTLIGVRGLVLYQQNPTYYLEPMSGIGSKNVFSNWTIAPLFLCAWFMGSRRVALRTKLLAFGAIAAMVIPQVLSLSRSGWVLLAATFAFTLLGRRSIRALAPGLLVGGVIYFALTQFEFHEKAERRFEDLRTGTYSDEFRVSIFRTAMEIFAENPVAGVSQADLPYEIGRSLQIGPVSTHNIYAELLGGMGIVGIVPLLGCAFVLLSTWQRALTHAQNSATAEIGLGLVVLVALGAIRGLTTQELLYNPAYMMGVAITFVACRMALKAEHDQQPIPASQPADPSQPAAAPRVSAGP